MRVDAAGQGTAVPDYHMHTRFSDGEGEMAAYVERAIALGLPEIGFSDHLVPPGYDQEGYGIGLARLEEYVSAVLDVRRRYPEMPVLLGVEVDDVPGTEAEMADALTQYPFDYVLGAVHFIDGVAFDEEERRGSEGGGEVNDVYRAYYKLLRRAVVSGRYTVIAHFDLPKKFGYRPSEAMTPYEDDALRAIAEAGTAIEVNTSGLYGHPVREMYPSRDILERARRFGVPLTFGSDAHRPADVGSHAGSAVTLARRAGYSAYLRLSDRREVALP